MSKGRCQEAHKQLQEIATSNERWAFWTVQHHETAEAFKFNSLDPYNQNDIYEALDAKVGMIQWRNNAQNFDKTLLVK